MPDDYLGRDDLLARGLSDDEADFVLAASGLTGHDRQPCVEAARVDDLLALADDGLLDRFSAEPSESDEPPAEERASA